MDAASEIEQNWARLRELADRFEAQSGGGVQGAAGAQGRGLYDPSITAGANSANIDVQRGGGVATYGWKMYEDEHERIMQEQDVQEILQRIREAALQDPAGTQDFLKEHPALASQLSAALFSAAGSAGNGVGITGSSGSSGSGGGFSGGWG